MSVVLVTGSAGLIGSETTRHFAALGYDIVGVRWDPDRGDNLVLFEKVLS